MNDPIKIIHKYKNNNQRIQYHINIFIGDIVTKECMEILTKIKNMDLYTSFISLTTDEQAIMDIAYGEYWYEKFFNCHHIINIKELINSTDLRKKEIRSIYGDKWFGTHIADYKRRFETVNYTYEYTIKEERERRKTNLVVQMQQQEIEDMIDYQSKGSNSEYFASMNRVTGGAAAALHIKGSQNKPFKIYTPAEQQSDWCSNESSESSESESESKLDADDHDLSYNTEEDPSDTSDIDYGDEDEDDQSSMDDAGPKQLGGEADDEYDEVDDPEILDLDLTDADLIYGDLDETDENIKLTTKEIKEAISNEMYDNLNKKILEFDSSGDNIMFDEDLKDVFHKNYITHQYIYKDDSIKNVHNKICCGFKNNNKFGDNTYIIPSYQYIWSEYFYNSQLKRIMIGQKWIVKNDVLILDVEPKTNLSHYGELRDKLKLLRDNIRRQGKIKREEDENNILLDYEGFYSCNELYMIDIYNELGTDYDPDFETLKNLVDVYFKIYFPKIRPDDIKNIIDFLSKNVADTKKISEKNKLKLVYETNSNDLILENEIMRDIELVKKYDQLEYVSIFKENYVNQSVIRAYLSNKNAKIDLFRIFDNFLLDQEYPFVQYQPIDGYPRYKYNEKYLIENQKKDLIMKWFENSPYGISFKVRILEHTEYKYVAINLSDNGRIDYKIQWKEDDMSTVEDISKTYHYVRKLINKIIVENEKNGLKLRMPTDDDFKFAFINTIQRIELPDDFVINHNDLSEFSRYFYPYVALVIEPRKRQSKIKNVDKVEKSKFGTYLRYKRLTNFENKSKIEHRIVFFMRNYEYDDQSLISEISNEFNITEDQAAVEINMVKDKYPNLKKSRRILKKMENIPKYKPPGIGIDIQGKNRNRYKMRIAGARNKDQLNRIITFMNILIYLYVDTYYYKKPDRQKMKDRLKRLTKIAHRRKKVDEIIKKDTSIKNVKQMTLVDKKRLSHKVDGDQDQWSRKCQNSGTDKKRHPQQFLNIEELQKLGYTWHEKLDGYKFGHYSKKVVINKSGKGKKDKEIILRAVQLPLDSSGENFVYYACDPEQNGRHMYIGFLNKSKNPNGEAMPCCFIKDHFYSKNKEKKNFYLKSIGLIEDETEEENKIAGDQLYILQDGNKIQEGRFSFLPKYLDIFMNFMLENVRTIKNHYLLSSPTGYYFKYGPKTDENKFLSGVSSVLDIQISEIKNMLVKVLESDKNSVIFTSLNNGDIRTRFKTKEAYITYIKAGNLKYSLVNDLICLPKVMRKDGINTIVFQKQTRIIRKSLEKEQVKANYYIVCQNSENVSNLKDPKRETLFFIKDKKNYYPIIQVKKEDENSKEIMITKTFAYGKDKTNIINHIFKYYKINCQSEFNILIKDKSSGSHTAKKTASMLKKTGDKNLYPKLQYVDARYKCKYLITQGGHIIPTLPSGTLYNLNLTDNVSSYTKNFKDTSKYLKEIYDATAGKLKILPIGVYYLEKKNKTYVISSIMTESYDEIPLIPNNISAETLKKEKMIIQKKQSDEIIDEEILNPKYNVIVDDRVYQVAKNKYEAEMYQFFRFHLSYYLTNTPYGIKYGEKLEKIINNTKISKQERKLGVKKVLYHISNNELSKTFNELLKAIYEQSGGETLKLYDPVDKDLAPTNKIVETLTAYDIRKMKELGKLDELKELEGLEDLVGPSGDLPVTLPEASAPLPYSINFPAKEKTWLHTMPDSKVLNYPSFEFKNNRELCYANYNKETCLTNQHCGWINSKQMCALQIKKDLIVDYINKVSEEFIQNELKAHEILKKGEYFVSDIIDYNVFTERPGEKIVISSNNNLNKLLGEIFGKDNIPRIGKRKNKFESFKNNEQINIENPLSEISDWYIQPIIENNNTIFRSFANSYYWLMHPYDDIITRNLGYYNGEQTELSNIYKSQVIDWIRSPENSKVIEKLLPYIKYGKPLEFATKLSTDVNTLTSCIVELSVLSMINETIIYVYDENYVIIFAFHPIQGIVYDFNKTKIYFDATKYKNYKKIIHLRFHYISKNIQPDEIEALYPKD